ncbi:MAG: SDR family oxidoreductase [Gammaproteobacteria bacterium]|nr:SDR family oxidoreductase [Gammaproteobacteria bacterium]MYK43760.1 SDR family oxidoreductase [Gammaproteobacteria bacterium]
MSNWFSIEGKIALVTGGSRGIGEMIAAGFLQHGAKVYISSRKAEVCDATAEKLQTEFGGTCISLPADLSKVDGVSELVAALKQRESKLDILINNAGTSWGAEFSEFPEFGWDKVMDTNVKGVFFLTQQCLPLLKVAGRADDPARVVNIGSVDGIRTPKFENYSYAASKAAVHHLTRQLAARLVKKHVNVNAIAPGPFPTWMLSTGVGFGGQVEGADWAKVGERNPSGRVGTLEDICGTTIYLCSRAGAFTVGTTITCDGGSIACS